LLAGGGVFVGGSWVDFVGTHVAGIIRSNPYGVVPAGIVIAIKVPPRIPIPIPIPDPYTPIPIRSLPPFPESPRGANHKTLAICLLTSISQVLDNTGTGTTSNLLAGIQRAHDHYFSGTNNPGGRTFANGYMGVINFSIGYSVREPLVENALQAVVPLPQKAPIPHPPHNPPSPRK